MYPYTLIRSARKTLSLSIDSTGRLLVRAPRRMPRAEIDRFVSAHTDWIDVHLRAAQERRARTRVLSPEEREALRRQASALLPALTTQWAARMGLEAPPVRITSAAHRWGSCSPRRICFSLRVMLLPDPLRELIVVHELTHLLVPNHSPDFYAALGRWLPDHRARSALLREWERAHPLADGS